MENTIKKMLKRDISVVLGFLVFLWVTMCFIMLSILTAVGSSQAKNTIIAIGVVSLLLATVSLVMLVLHLRKNREEIYAEEIRNSKVDSEEFSPDAFVEETVHAEVATKKHSCSSFVKIFDIMFIMVLCFVTLLAAMLLRGKTVSGASIYSFGITSALVTLVGFTVYFVNVLKNSNKELKLMIDELYSEEAKTE